MTPNDFSRLQARDLLDFIDASPSPWHAVATIEKQLKAEGFIQLNEPESWQLENGGRYYVIRDDSSIIMFTVGSDAPADAGFKIIGAHTDSPSLRVKPNAGQSDAQLLRVGVEVYGGAIIATFADRDLSLAGRVSYREQGGDLVSKLICFEQALLRLPNLAIHMNREVNEKGLKLDKQTGLPLILATLSEELPAQQQFTELIAQQAGIDTDALLSWELNIYDTQKGEFWGLDEEFIANSQLDNLASCHAGLQALLSTGTNATKSTHVCAFFDHEEVGSESSKGADGSFLSDVLERINLATGHNKEEFCRALSQSFMISADMAHAYQPSFAWAYEPEHRVNVNAGPVIKINANQRYSSESISEAMFIDWCQQADVPFQKYSHRSDIPCGSTIGPMTSARLGIRTVDVGNPMWAMHSIRESAGVADHGYIIKVFEQFFRE